MPFGAGFVPVSLAYNIAYPPARVLYALDKTSGDMSFYNASNFSKSGDLQLQCAGSFPEAPKAFDLAVFPDGYNGFVSHVTSGTETYQANPIPGRLSWLDIDIYEYGVPSLRDADDNPDTTSPGAPTGKTRVDLCVGDSADCDEGYNAYFYPLSIKIVNLATDVPGYEFSEWEPDPGTYAFVSGIGYLEEGHSERKAMVAILDLNQYLHCDGTPWYCFQHRNCRTIGNYCNPRWWGTRILRDGAPANYKTLEAGADTTFYPGTSKHAMDFAPDTGRYEGEHFIELGPTLYMLNQDQDKAYLFNYDPEAWDWYPVLDAYEEQVFIATGTEPTGIKVQKVEVEPEVFETYAYITNAGDDTVYAVDTASNSLAGYMNQRTGCNDITHIPMSFDARVASTGGGQNFGYSSDMESDTVSVYDLPDMTMGQTPDPCVINLPANSAPADIIIQPVPDPNEIFQQMLGMMIFSEPSDYAIPEDQEQMLGNWKAIHQLVLTPASPQAIKAAIDAFLHKIDQKVAKDKLKKHLKQGVKLYKVAYVHDHPGNQ
jgi:hypothetical protein